MTDYGRVSPAVPNSTQPVSVATTGLAQVQTGQPNSASNPPELSNAGRDPYGLSDIVADRLGLSRGRVAAG